MGGISSPVSKMPRRAKTKRMAEWLDREQAKLTGGVTNRNLIIAAPLWVIERLSREGVSKDAWNSQLRLPSGKAVRHQMPDDATYVIVYPGQHELDVSRFLPKDQTGIFGSGGEVRRPLSRARRVVRTTMLDQSLSRNARITGITPDRATRIPRTPRR
jgi:hypothetical protein